MVERKDKSKLVRASIQNLPITPRKARLVVDLIRKLPIPKALNVLSNMPQRSAPEVLKLLNSGIANATNNFGFNFNELVIAEIFVNEGRKLKRFRPRAKGATAPIWKRACHIWLTLTVNKEQAAPAKLLPRKTKGKIKTKK